GRHGVIAAAEGGNGEALYLVSETLVSRRRDPSHAILFWLRLWGAPITARTAQSVSVLPSSVAISIAEVRDAFCRRQHSPVSDCSWVRPTTHRARLTLFRSVFEVNPRYGVCRGGSSPSLAVTGTGALES